LFVIGDLIAAATPIGLFFGRIANFVNGELWGKVTEVSWGVVFCNDVVLENNFGRCPAGTEPRHPSQIYEALLEGVLLFVILRVAMLRFGTHRRPGMVTAAFMAGYGVFRFVVEFFRDSESKIYAWFSVGQALSVPMLLAAALFAWYAYRTSVAKPVK
jgi:phosphatidylglycerol:prolipoprotein diacylglycerol transferase